MSTEEIQQKYTRRPSLVRSVKRFEEKDVRSWSHLESMYRLCLDQEKLDLLRSIVYYIKETAAARKTFSFLSFLERERKKAGKKE